MNDILQSFLTFYNSLINETLDQPYFPVLYQMFEVIHQIKTVVLHDIEHDINICRAGEHYYNEFTQIIWIKNLSGTESFYIEQTIMHIYVGLLNSQKLDMYSWEHILKIYEVFTCNMISILSGKLGENVMGRYFLHTLFYIITKIIFNRIFCAGIFSIIRIFIIQICSWFNNSSK